MLGFDKILQDWGVPASLLLYFAFFIASFWQLKKYYFNCIKSETDRPKLLAQLEAPNGWRIVYHAALQGQLDRLDRWLKPPYKNQQRPNLAISSFPKAAPWFWSAQAFGINLTIAVFYPVILLLLFWTFGNINTSGIEGVLPETLPGWRRYAKLLLLFQLAFLIFEFPRKHLGQKLSWLIGTIAIAAAVAGIGIGVGATAIAIVTVGAGLISVAAAGAITIAFAFATAGGIAISIAGAILFFIFGAVLLIAVWIYVKSLHSNRLWLFFLRFCLLAIVALATSFSFPSIVTNHDSIYLLTFMAAIPLINALYDYFSLGLTRYLLQQSLDANRNLIRNAIIDFAAACLFLLGLSLTLVFALSGLNWIAAGAHPIDVGGILSRLRHTPADVSLWWIFVMIFSTFLPTFVHAAIALGNMPITRLPKGWRNKVIAGLKELENGGDSHDAKEKGAWYFSIQRSWSAVITILAIILLGMIVVYFLPGLGRTLLYLCEALAESMGEDISPGRIFPFFGSVLT